MITHETQRFSTVIDGHLAKLDYTCDGTIMTITHTNVPDALGGRGIAGQLTQAAFDHARAAGWKIVPACSYAAAWVKRHASEQDLLA
jgi:uncharacterized protein